MNNPGDRIPPTQRGMPTAAAAWRSVSVVIPAKNEAANIGWVLERLPSFVDEVVIVDGRSCDGTVAVVRAHRPDAVIVLDDRPGKGAAVRAGVAAASGDVVVMLDADGSMNPEEIERFVQPLFDGHELVRGSRNLPGAGSADISVIRDIGNRVLLGIANRLFGTSRTDLCYGYAAFRREAFQRLGLTADGFEIEAQLFLRAERANLRVVEVPSFEAPRRHGVSNLSTVRDGWRVLKTVMQEWSGTFEDRRRRRADQPIVMRRAGPALVALPIADDAAAIAAFVEPREHDLPALASPAWAGAAAMDRGPRSLEPRPARTPELRTTRSGGRKARPQKRREWTARKDVALWRSRSASTTR